MVNFVALGTVSIVLTVSGDSALIRVIMLRLGRLKLIVLPALAFAWVIAARSVQFATSGQVPAIISEALVTLIVSTACAGETSPTPGRLRLSATTATISRVPPRRSEVRRILIK